MRYESSVSSISWIPSEAIPGIMRLPVDLGVGHYDSPPPDVLEDISALRSSENCRFANELRAWIEVENGRITDCGYSGGGFVNPTIVNLAGIRIRVPSITLPVLHSAPDVGVDCVTFTQTFGGRTRAPAMRPSRSRPFIHMQFPVVWTTLAQTIHANGSSSCKVVGASPFPRHWIYDSTGRLVQKSGLADFDGWFTHASGGRHPWSGMNLPALIQGAETRLEREMSVAIMHGGHCKPSIFELKPGKTLVRQGEAGEQIFLLLDGVLAVEVGGRKVAEIGPGAVLGERARLEDGVRTATLRAATRCRVACSYPVRPGLERLAELSSQHRRETMS